MTAKAWVKTEDYEGECRRMSNGTPKLIWTLAMSACGVVFIGFMAWMTTMNSSISSLEASVTSQAVVSSSRMSVLEAVVQTVDTRLTRMEGKLDQLAGRRR